MAKSAVVTKTRTPKATKAQVIPIKPKSAQKAKATKLAKPTAKGAPSDFVRPHWEHEIWTVEEYIKKIHFDRTIKIDPYTNRGSTVEVDSKKHRDIIECIFNGVGVTGITLRDITGPNAANLKELYPAADHIVQEGGHRSRGICYYWNNEFPAYVAGLNGEYTFEELPAEYQRLFLDFPLVINLLSCTEKQAQDIFDCHNRVTIVKGYSKIMSNGESKVCAYVRQFTKTWPEYNNGNTCHPLFSVTTKRPVCFKAKVPNKGNLWDTFVFVTIHKVIGGGNVDAGEEVSKTYVDNNTEVPKKVQDEVKKFWDTFYSVYEISQNKITDAYFGCFQALYFDLYKSKKRNLNIHNVRVFANAFNKAFSEITKTKKKELIKVNGEDVHIGKFINKASIAFTKPGEQTRVALEIKTRMKENGYAF